MDVLIKHVDEQAYRELKAAAARKSMRVGKAASEAFLSWTQQKSKARAQARKAFRHMKEIREGLRGWDGAGEIRRQRDARK